MAQAMTMLTQSQYYSPCLNGAIFDGSFKIFFAQEQESLGLSVYLQLQKQLGSIYTEVKSKFQSSHFSIYIIIYPSSESFHSVANNNEIKPGLFEGRVNET